jgi:hypothetical protein
MFFGGFPSLPVFPDARWQFEPLPAYADIRFEVLDRRLEAEKQFRRLTPGEPRYIYGDGQFLPTRMRVVATHFAAAFPRDGDNTQLVIERLEMIDYVPRPSGDPDAVKCGGGGPAIAIPSCAALVLAGRAISNPDRNSVTGYLSGSYAGIPFSASASANYYSVPGSPEHRAAVTGALLATITEAIKEVRAERVAKDSLAAHDTLPPTAWVPLPLPFAPNGVPPILEDEAPKLGTLYGLLPMRSGNR